MLLLCNIFSVTTLRPQRGDHIPVIGTGPLRGGHIGTGPLRGDHTGTGPLRGGHIRAVEGIITDTRLLIGDTVGGLTQGARVLSEGTKREGIGKRMVQEPTMRRRKRRRN